MEINSLLSICDDEVKKSMAEKHIDLDSGDKVEIIAKVFSTALNDPWLDIEKLTVIQKAKK